MAFIFPKYCKRCGQGINRPNQWDRKSVKALFRVGFCKPRCHEEGERHEGTFPAKARAADPGIRGDYPLEELAFVALEIKRQEESMSPMKRLVRQTNQAFNLLSEKLSYLEMETGERWYREKFYYWMGRAK